MTFKSYRDESRKEYGSSNGGNLTLDQLTAGALLRIADATEKMCLDRETLERNYQCVRKQRDRYRERWERSERSRASLKGVITRLKKAARGGE